jgi:U4/U6 small nuclear ribonucleoprotein PRP4
MCLWSIGGDMENKKPLGVFEGHELRINRVAWHPTCTQFVFSTSDDETWRMWDVERQEELLLQEGHAGGVFGVAIHPDGSLIATSDTVGVIRVWDIRTGRSILDFQGHAEQVVGVDFSPNGFHLASCSGDNTVCVWDLRARSRAEILPGHTKLVSSVKYDRENGGTLMTAGYDCVAKIWRTCDYKVVKNLPIHETRIMGADLNKSGTAVVTGCYDRTFKVWSTTDATKRELDIVKKEDILMQ